MPRSSRSIDPRAESPGSEEGSAAVEFVLVGVLLLAPLVYLILALGLVQGQSLGAEAAARHIARAVSTARDADDARARADAVLDAVSAEYGLDDVDLAIDCDPAAACPSAGATLHVRVRAVVALPLVPAILDLDRMAAIPVEASAAHKVSRYWSER